MGLFDDDLLPDDDYVDSDTDNDDELGSDYHVSAQPPMISINKPSEPVKITTNKQLPERLRAKGITLIHIVKKNGKEYTFV